MAEKTSEANKHHINPPSWLKQGKTENSQSVYEAEKEAKTELSFEIGKWKRSPVAEETPEDPHLKNHLCPPQMKFSQYAWFNNEKN